MVYLFGTQTKQGTDKETARRLLAFAAGNVWGWGTLPSIDRAPGGKPFFPDHPDRRFNLSHAGGLVLCALSDEGEVGVDIERVIPRREGFPAYVMTEKELDTFDKTWEDFYRVWTLKEAYAKYQGRSIHAPRTLPVPPPVPHRTYAGEGWRAALCGEGPLPADICWVEL